MTEPEWLDGPGRVQLLWSCANTDQDAEPDPRVMPAPTRRRCYLVVCSACRLLLVDRLGEWPAALRLIGLVERYADGLITKLLGTDDDHMIADKIDRTTGGEAEANRAPNPSMP